MRAKHHWLLTNRTFPCMEANYPYAIKNQRGASKKTLVGGFGCDELVLYGIRDTGGATLWTILTNESRASLNLDQWEWTTLEYMTKPFSPVSWLERLLGLTSSPGLPSSASDLLGTASGPGVEAPSSRTGELSSDWLELWRYSYHHSHAINNHSDDSCWFFTATGRL